jgi:hypothetical protein
MLASLTAATKRCLNYTLCSQTTALQIQTAQQRLLKECSRPAVVADCANRKATWECTTPLLCTTLPRQQCCLQGERLIDKQAAPACRMRIVASKFPCCELTAGFIQCPQRCHNGNFPERLCLPHCGSTLVQHARAHKYCSPAFSRQKHIRQHPQQQHSLGHQTAQHCNDTE